MLTSCSEHFSKPAGALAVAPPPDAFPLHLLLTLPPHSLTCATIALALSCHRARRGLSTLPSTPRSPHCGFFSLRGDCLSPTCFSLSLRNIGSLGQAWWLLTFTYQCTALTRCSALVELAKLQVLLAHTPRE